MPASVSTPTTLKPRSRDSEDATARSCRAPVAWPSDTSRGSVLAERANSVVWAGQRGQGASLQVVVLDPEATALERARFVDGARRLQALGQVPGLTHVVDVDDSGRWYASDDPTAVELARADLPGMPLVERLNFVIAVLGALHSLHARGLVHGALCAENVLVTAQRGPILTEVGIVDVALLVGRDGTRFDDYRPFAAPEVARGDSFDFEADVYSVGRILEYVLVGRLVEPGERRTLAFGAHGELAEALAGIAARATQEEREARYPSVRGMMRALHRLIEDSYGAPGGGEVGTPRDAIAHRSASGGSPEESMRISLIEPAGRRLGCPALPAGRLRSDGNRRSDGQGTRIGTPRAASAVHLVLLVLVVLVVATIWLVR